MFEILIIYFLRIDLKILKFFFHSEFFNTFHKYLTVKVVIIRLEPENERFN